MANVGDTVVLKANGKDAVVTDKFTSPVPSELARPQGYWEAGNINQIPEWYLSTTSNIALDAERNKGKEAQSYTPTSTPDKSDNPPDWSADRKFASSGAYDSIPYVEYTVRNVPADAGAYKQGVGNEQSVMDVDFGGQIQRAVSLTSRSYLTDVAFTNNAGIVRATKVGHGLVDGTQIQISNAVTGGGVPIPTYNGTWVISYIGVNTFDLISSVYTVNGSGIASFGTPTTIEATKLNHLGIP